MANIPPDKEIKFVFNRDNGFKQYLDTRTASSGCIVYIDGTISVDTISVDTISASNYQGVSGYDGPTITQGTWTPVMNDFNFQMSFPPSGIPSRWTRIDNVVTLQHVIDISVFATASIPDVAITGLPFTIETPSELFGQVVAYSSIGGVRSNIAVQGFSDQSNRIRLLMFQILETGSGRITNTWTYTTTD